MRFTTRPEIQGTFGVCASTHWIASGVGMGVLERGGNAFDAAVAMGFALHVVEPHLNGPLGDMPALVRPAGADAPTVVCGQGPAPAGLTIAHCRAEGLDLVPGSGLLAAVVPGAFDAWMLIARDHGTWPLRDLLEPAIAYAESGHPVLPRVCDTIAGLARFFREEWPSSAAVWLPGGRPPEPGSLFANPDLAATWRRLLGEAEGARGREAQIERARETFYAGFVAEAIDRWMREACVMDGAGGRRRGVLTGQDMARWRASTEAPVSADHHGWTVWKPGFWSQGPVLLQSLRLIEGDVPPEGAGFAHRVAEALKLAMADREAYYGDPLHAEVPAETLLSPAYAEARRGLIGPEASREQRPGGIAGLEAWAEASLARAARAAPEAGPGGGEPTMAHLAERRGGDGARPRLGGRGAAGGDDPRRSGPAEGDTVHLDVIDRWGNMVSATPSGGWLQSSPVVPGLGMPLGSRAQMFWLEEGLPSSLAPGRRPRTTLSPSMAEGPRGAMAFGTPGGDQQDQWQLAFLLRVIHHGLSLQEAIDAPLFHTGHVPSSFFPRAARPGHLMAEPALGEAALAELGARGHDLEVAEPWSVGRLTAAARGPTGLLRAAATPRLMQAYAVGR